MSEGKILEINPREPPLVGSRSKTSAQVKFVAYEKSKKRSTISAVKSFTKDRKKRLLMETSV